MVGVDTSGGCVYGLLGGVAYMGSSCDGHWGHEVFCAWHERTLGAGCKVLENLICEQSGGWLRVLSQPEL